jgi:monofunctional biosynthetic peptidoglycan transglycosylase
LKSGKSGKSGKGSPRRRWARWLAIGFAILALLPAVEVLLVRFIDPPITPLMLLRPLEDKWAGLKAPPRQYTWRDLKAMPPEFVKLVLVGEDQRFFAHRGFDWKEVRIARARAEKTGQPVRGASTISMQCARSLFLWQGRSWMRKGLELYYTFWMELFLPKRRILELYLNVIEMGDGVYGLEAAAQTHFHTTARKLTHEQCAQLAALLPAPRSWDPKAPSPKYSARIAKLLRQEREVSFPELNLR